jgi:hypothetical protein
MFTAQIYCRLIFMSLDCLRKPLEGSTSMLDDCAGSCCTVVQAAAQGIVCRWNMLMCASLGTLSQWLCRFFDCCSAFIHQHPQMGFSCTYLMWNNC